METKIEKDKESTQKKVATDSVSASTKTRVFELNDGTKITGILIGTNEEGFVVQTQSIGTLTIPSAELTKMSIYSETNSVQKTNPKSASLQDHAPTRNLPSTPQEPISKRAASNTSGPDKSIIANLKDKLMQDPDILGDLYTLQNDPSVMGIVQDPEIIMLIQSGDFAALANHPAIKKLEANKSIQSIIKSAQP